MSDTTATEYAREVTSWHPHSWWELEAHAFREHAGVRKVLRSVAPAEARKAFDDRLTVLGIVRAVVQLAATFLPVVAAAIAGRALLSSRGPVDLGLMGVLFAIALVLALPSLPRSSHPERHDPGTTLKVGLLAHIAPAIAALIIGIAALATGRADGILWVIAVGADLALWSYVVLRFGRVRKDASGEDADRAVAALRRELDALTAAEAAAVRADVQGAVDTLAERGLVTADDALHARGADIGTLAAWMLVGGDHSA